MRSTKIWISFFEEFLFLFWDFKLSFMVCVACNIGTSIAIPNVASIKIFHKIFFAQLTIKIVLPLMAASCRTTTDLVGIVE